MAPGGFLCFYDFMDVTPALFWGLSEQCWGFEDERDFSLWCSFPRWNRLLTDAGFEQARPLPSCVCPGQSLPCQRAWRCPSPHTPRACQQRARPTTGQAPPRLHAVGVVPLPLHAAAAAEAGARAAGHGAQGRH